LIVHIKTTHVNNAYISSGKRENADTFAGQLLTQDQEDYLTDWVKQPNYARWFIFFASNPQRIIDYIAANCSTSTVGGADIAGWSERDDFAVYLGNVSIFRQFSSHLKAGIGFSRG
jgi:hypothetical protein